MPAADPTTTVSAVLIVKDEEDVLAECLAALDWVDEIVVYDTGSTDATKQVAARFTERVVDGWWDDDFGAARNRALAHATGEWVLVVDADEVFDGDGEAARRQIEGAAAAGVDRFVVTVHSGHRDEVMVGGEAVNVRIFRRGRYHYVGRLHEQVVPVDPAGPTGGIVTLRNTRLLHSGYSAAAMSKHDKLQRNLDIARRDLEAGRAGEATEERLAVLEANLARALGAAGHHEEALDLGDRLLAEGRVPEGTMILLAQAMTGAAMQRGDAELTERWLTEWETVDYSPMWARAARVRVAASRGEVDAVLDLLEQIPTTSVDSVGRRHSKHELVGIEAWALTIKGRTKDAVRRCTDAARAGYVSVSPEDLVTLHDAVGRPLRTFVEAMHPGIWRTYAVWAARDAGAEDQRFLRTMLEVRPGDVTVLLCAAGTAGSLPLEQLAEWASEVRRAGLGEVCPLVAAAQDEDRDLRTRALAAAMAVGIYEDARALPGLEAALAAVPADMEETLLVELDVVAPGLVTRGGSAERLPV